MECNKDEAIRAKGIAETKLESKDFAGARRIAIKAQRLYPDLEHISQIICLCDVHCPADNRNLGDEKDWYGILKVEQSADEASIKKQYRKLALLLHPDKNKFAGADAAFLLIGEAQKVLLDREKRSLFDARYRRFSQNTTPNPPPTENKNANNVKPPSGQTNATKKASSRMKKKPKGPKQQATNVKPPLGKTSTKQKACPHVKKQSEQQASSMKPPSGKTNMTQKATSHVKDQTQPHANCTKPPSGQTNTTQDASAQVKRQPPQEANTVKPPSGQTNMPQDASAQVKRQPPQETNTVKPPSGQTNTTQDPSAQVKKQPQQQASSVKPPSGQSNTTKSSSTHAKKQPQQQVNFTKSPSGQTNTTQNANSDVKKQPQQQANNVKPPSGQTNTTQNACSHVKKHPRQQANSGVHSGSPTFKTVCPWCMRAYRYFRYALKTTLQCKSCQVDFIAYEHDISAESRTPQSNANQTATRVRVVSNQGAKCSASNSRSQGNSGHPPPGRKANKTAFHPKKQGGSSTTSNVRLPGNSGQRNPGVDLFAKSGKTTEQNTGATKISRTTFGGCSHSTTNTAKVVKKVVESGDSVQSKGATSSKAAAAGSGCGGDGSNQQRSPQLKRHSSYNGTGSDIGTLNSSKRIKTEAPSVLSPTR